MKTAQSYPVFDCFQFACRQAEETVTKTIREKVALARSFISYSVSHCKLHPANHSESQHTAFIKLVKCNITVVVTPCVLLE